MSQQQTYNNQSFSLSPQLVKLKQTLISPAFLSVQSNHQYSVDDSKVKTLGGHLSEQDYYQQQDRYRKISVQKVYYNGQVDRIVRKLKIYHFPPIKNIRNILKKGQEMAKKQEYQQKNEQIIKKSVNSLMKKSAQLRPKAKNEKDMLSFFQKMVTRNKKILYKPSHHTNMRSLSVIRQSNVEQYKKPLQSQLKRSVKVHSVTEMYHNHHQKRLYSKQKPLKWHEMNTQYMKQERTAEQMYFQPFLQVNQDNIPDIPRKQRIKAFLRTYQPIYYPINMANLIKNNFFSVEYSQTFFYFGEMIGKNKNGLGILIKKDICFEGQWKNNMKVKGIEINKYGVYKGTYSNDKRQGKGIFQWNNQSYYVGHWKNDQQNGYGLWMNQDGQSYKGNWKNGKIQGFGALQIKEKTIIKQYKKYRGHFIDFKQNGFGRQVFNSQDSFQGFFKNGRPHGKGLYKWSFGAVYEGQFNNGIRNGMGTLITSANMIYKGQFIQQKAEGECQIALSNGDIYYGMIKNGKRNGKGTLQTKKGKHIYNGYWKDDNFLSDSLSEN